MAHHALTIALGALAGAVGAGLVAGCGAPPSGATAPVASSAAVVARPVSRTGWEDKPVGRFHSKRFAFWIPLPDGATWKINDHRSSWLTATHAPTSSSLSVRVYLEDEAVNRARCEAHVRADDPALPTEPLSPASEARDRSILAGWDAHSLVATVPHSKPGQPLDVEGHLVVFGAQVRRCLVVHFATRAVGAEAEEVVGARLGEAARIVRDIEWVDELQGPGREPPLRAPGRTP